METERKTRCKETRMENENFKRFNIKMFIVVYNVTIGSMKLSMYKRYKKMR